MFQVLQLRNELMLLYQKKRNKRSSLIILMNKERSNVMSRV
jgi:hypothetical protein